MSLIAAIDAAVRLQLACDVPTVPVDYSKVMKDATPGGYGFTDTTLDAFLQDVSNRLIHDIPSLHFDWARSDTGKCLRAKLHVLIGLIASDTTVITGANR